MNLSVRGRLFLISLLSLAVFAGAIGFLLEQQIGAMLLDRNKTALSRQAFLAGEVLASMDAGQVDEAADRLGEQTDRRVTLIAENGEVLADSERDGPALVALDNHNQRPEVIQAREEGQGHARRYSSTVGEDMLYTALLVDEGQVVRVSMGSSEADAPLMALRRLLFGTIVLGFLAAGGISAFASHQVTRGLREALARAGLGGDAVTTVNALLEEQRRNFDALSDEKNRFQRVLDGMREGLLLLDAEDRVVTANRRAQQLVALERVDELSLVDEGELDLQGHTLQLQISELADGERVVLMRDVTDLRRLETVRQDFVANVSHELRTPVSVIRTNVDALQAGAMDEPELAMSFLDAIDRNANRLGALIADLLSLARLDSGQPLLVEAVDVGAIAWRVRESLWERADQKLQDLVLRVEPGATAMADSGALEQVLTNFIENSIKYTPEGGTIELRYRAVEGRARVEVHDDGPGVPVEVRDRVFERFYRVDKGRSRLLGGTGLGLSIVRRLAGGMQGTVGVGESDLGGAVFHLDLALPSDDAV